MHSVIDIYCWAVQDLESGRLLHCGGQGVARTHVMENGAAVGDVPEAVVLVGLSICKCLQGFTAVMSRSMTTDKQHINSTMFKAQEDTEG